MVLALGELELLEAFASENALSVFGGQRRVTAVSRKLPFWALRVI